MHFLNNVLRKIINKQHDFCCLCFKSLSTPPIYFEDEVILVENSIGSNLKMSEILICLFGDNVFHNLSTFEAVCEQCSVAAINSYKFITDSKESIQYLTDMVDLLVTTCENTSPDNQDSSTLFVTLNPDLCTSKLIFDSAIIKNSYESLKQLNAINDIKLKTEIKTEKEDIKLTQKLNMIGNSKFHVRDPLKVSFTHDMLFDKNDPTNLKCKECLKSFTTAGNLRNHFIRIHYPKAYKCNKCDRRFGSKAILLAHKEGSHVTLVCSDCGKTFHNKYTLKMHERSHYLKLVCQSCGRVYKNHNTYKKHLENEICQRETRRSQIDAKFTCDYCNKKYTQKMTLRVHIQYEHLNYKYLECKWCKKKFWCQSRLNAHSVKHTKERNFNCTICNGKFVTRESLLYHTRIHTGEKPYPCPHCESRFLSASRRSAHVKSHHMDPTVECDICHSKFRSHHYLQKHKKIHSIEENRIEIEIPEISGTEISQPESLIPTISTYPNSHHKRQYKIKVVPKQKIFNSPADANVQLNYIPKTEFVDNEVSSDIKFYFQVDSNLKETQYSTIDGNEIVEVHSNPYVYQTCDVESKRTIDGDKDMHSELSSCDKKF